ncbi:stage II sporulation protein M [Candidatus Pacearchaeota archaeon]|nr:stage II sporulation protein M [Candidatus Pacearchaeota archaeon]
MNKKRGFSLKKEYKQSWNYIKESKNFIYISIGIFFAFFFLALFVSPPEILSNQIFKFIQEILEKTQGMSATELVSFIFLNNLQSSFFGMIFGIGLGVVPFLALISNGYLLGFVSSLTTVEYGVLSLWRLLPHGIFELPAIFISLGLGLKLGLWLIIEPIRFYWSRNKLISFLFLLFYLPTLIITLYFNKQFNVKMRQEYNVFSANFWNSFKVFLFIVIPLLIIAGIIEGILIAIS